MSESSEARTSSGLTCGWVEASGMVETAAVDWADPDELVSECGVEETAGRTRRRTNTTVFVNQLASVIRLK